MSNHSFALAGPYFASGDGLTEASEKTSEKTSDRIVALLKESPTITIAQLADHIGVTTRSIERNLKKLQDSLMIQRVGPDKGGHWEVRNE